LISEERCIPRAQPIAMLDELHLQNSAVATHHQVQGATHCPPIKSAVQLP